MNVGEVRESLLRFWPIGEPWETLRQRIADDAELLAVAARTAPENVAQDQTWRVLLAAIAHLGTKHGFPIPADASPRSFARLRKALLAHSTELIALLGRHAQINDPLRCTALYAGLLFAARRVSAPLALVEVGCSLGLNLCMDLYAYRYRGAGDSGAGDSRCRLSAVVDDLAARSSTPPRRCFPFRRRAPAIGARIGLELAPVGLDNESVAWLRAFHFPRPYRIFDAAVAIRRRTPVAILPGDAAETLPEALARIPEEQVPVVFHTSVVYQMSTASRERMLARLAEGAVQRRLLYMTWAEEPARRGAPLTVTDFDLEHGAATRHLLAFVNRWQPVPKLEWVYSDSAHR